MATVLFRRGLRCYTKFIASVGQSKRFNVKLEHSSRIDGTSFGKRYISTETNAQTDDPFASFGGRHTVTLIPGDGVGPELAHSVKQIFTAAGVPIDWEEIHVSDVVYGSRYTLDDVLDSMRRTGVGLKGALTTPTSISSQDHLALSQKLKVELDLFANVVHCKSLPGFKTRHNDVDLLIIREQTEGEYTSLEHESIPGVVEMMKVITRKKSQRIAKFTFDYATKQQRKKVTAIHKANIISSLVILNNSAQSAKIQMLPPWKKGDGLFLETCEEVSKLYPKIQFESMIVDNCCMQLVAKPNQFDVMVLPNLYGSIVDNVGAALVGGAGVVPGKNIGSQFAIFEPGARHTYSQMAGKNVANPTAMILAGVEMLEHMNMGFYARLIRDAVEKTIMSGKYLTMDMGGSTPTSEFVHAIIGNLTQHHNS